MPYKDPDKQREFKREWQRARREEARQGRDKDSRTQLQSLDDVLLVLEEQVGKLRRDTRLPSTDRAKAIAQLATLSVKVIESRDIQRKVEGIESVVRMRDPVLFDRSRAA